MARPLRLHMPGGFYHVTLRGNHRLPIFFAEQDRSLLDEIVAEVTTKHSSHVHAYCWMTNHLHMALQVSDLPLGRVILEIASRYARTVQSRLETTGHLFERRYHCVLVDVDKYLLALVRYIHLNPVKAGLIADPADYRWSSHQDYIGRVRRPWVKTGFVMGMLATDPTNAGSGYRALMGNTDLPDWDEVPQAPGPCRNQILGDENFAARVTPHPLRPRSRWNSLDELVTECGLRFGCSPELLASPSKLPGLAAARAWLSHEAVGGGLTTICAVARRLNRCESAIRQLMVRYPRKETIR
ncbi:MAG TPA: transposase [Steroidobacteraceae bacterium]